MPVASLHIHPVKSLRAVDVDHAAVTPRGLEGDRRWMIVDDQGQFITQRKHPVLATITARPGESGLEFSAPRAEPLMVRVPSGGDRRKVVVWGATVDAVAADSSVGDWLTSQIGKRASLVFMDDAAERLKDSVWTPTPVAVSFADAFPVLVVNAASLAAVNDDIVARGGEAVPMTRFRPNIVVDCDEPWAEDHWKAMCIGHVVIDLVKPSDRCIVTTTDQTSGKRMGKEPLASLARLHRSTDPRINGVIFGMNAVPRHSGEVSVGSDVEIIQ